MEEWGIHTSNNEYNLSLFIKKTRDAKTSCIFASHIFKIIIHKAGDSNLKMLS